MRPIRSCDYNQVIESRIAPNLAGRGENSCFGKITLRLLMAFWITGYDCSHCHTRCRSNERCVEDCASQSIPNNCYPCCWNCRVRTDRRRHTKVPPLSIVERQVAQEQTESVAMLLLHCVAQLQKEANVVAHTTFRLML